MYIIMGNDYTNYNNALNYLGTEKLSKRRSNLCLSFALKCEKNLKYRNWFALSEPAEAPIPNTRSDNEYSSTKYIPVATRTDRYMDSPIFFLNTYIGPFHGLTHTVSHENTKQSS